MRKLTVRIAIATFGAMAQCHAGDIPSLPECDSDDFACQRIVAQMILQRAARESKSDNSTLKPHEPQKSTGAQPRTFSPPPTAEQLAAIHRMSIEHRCKDKADWANIYSGGKDRTIEDLLCRVEVLEERVRDLEENRR